MCSKKLLSCDLLPTFLWMLLYSCDDDDVHVVYEVSDDDDDVHVINVIMKRGHHLFTITRYVHNVQNIHPEGYFDIASVPRLQK